MARVHFRGTRHSRVRVPAMVTSLQIYCDMSLVEARAFAERAARGERLTVQLDDPDIAYTLAAEMVELGVHAEADESDY